MFPDALGGYDRAPLVQFHPATIRIEENGSLLRLLFHPTIRELRAPDRRRDRFAMLAMTGRGVFGLGVPWYFGGMVEKIVSHRPATEIWLDAAFLLAFAAGTAVCQFWMRWLFIGSSRNFECRLRDTLFAHITKLSFPW
ncbi:MAG: hypothetical protein KDB53_10145, partial [Planctomycetes bacterium]|nr:hypothetical protein [Planctomycetota bacterium]